MGNFAGLWCRLMHGEQAFTLPTPHPKGQEFRIRCSTCGRVYSIIRAESWTSPWRKQATIISDDHESPVHEYDGKWWHWDAARKDRVGPFNSERAAKDAYNHYAADASTWEPAKDTTKTKPTRR